VNAQRVARDKWVARCPAHDDHSPSLSIKEGFDGRIVIRCWTGCSTEAVLRVLNLTFRDLFPGPPPSPEQLAAMKARREARQAKRRQALAQQAKAREELEQSQMVVNMLGATLARNPDDHAIANAFHDACERRHEAQRSLDAAIAVRESQLKEKD
jgi:hypothetical protein